MLGRKDRTGSTAVGGGAADQQEAHPHREGAKNRPTPKRRDQEAARRRPLVANDARSRRAADRDARREQASRMRQAMITGDERHLPPRDKGPVRRFVRDSVDRRYTLGEVLLPLMLLVLVLSLLAPPSVASWVFLAVYAIALLAIVDAVLLWLRTKKRVLERFGPETPLRGLGVYTAMRAFQMRRTRMPKPMVGRGDPVR